MRWRGARPDTAVAVVALELALLIIGAIAYAHDDGAAAVAFEQADTIPFDSPRWNLVDAADFEYIRERNLLLIPTFVDNRVAAYRLQEK